MNIRWVKYANKKHGDIPTVITRSRKRRILRCSSGKQACVMENQQCRPKDDDRSPDTETDDAFGSHGSPGFIAENG